MHLIPTQPLSNHYTTCTPPQPMYTCTPPQPLYPAVHPSPTIIPRTPLPNHCTPRTPPKPLNPAHPPGITQTERLLPRMWLMIGDLGHDNDYGLSVLSEAFETDNRAIFSLLSLVCDTSSQILT